MDVEDLNCPAPAIVAEQSVEALRASPAVLAICLLGSVARGDARPDSDVDLLVITSRRSGELRPILQQSRDAEAVSLICRTPQQVLFAAGGSLFLAHVRTEGRVLHDPDGILARSFAAAARVPIDTDGEIRRRLASLKHYRNLDRFGGNYLFALAHLYGIAKGVAMARCAKLGRTTFIKADALARIGAFREFCQDFDSPIRDWGRFGAVDAVFGGLLGCKRSATVGRSQPRYGTLPT